MESRARALGHPIHQQLVAFPVGLLATAVVFDVLHYFWDNEALTEASFLMIAAGILAGLLAAVFGVIDFLAIPKGTRAKRIGLTHAVGNDVVLVLFAVSWFLRVDEPANEPTTLAFVLGLAGAGLLVVTGWLGGELVDRLGVGVSPDADLDAPSSLSSGVKVESR